MPLLEVKGIKKQFGGLMAVDNLSFEVNENEIVSIIGPNGAGKTTVFNMITGVYKIDAGEILFENEIITNKKSEDIVKYGISRTFQNIRLFKQLRVIENVLIGMHINTDYGFFDALFQTKRFHNIEKKVTQEAIDILESIGLGNYIDDYAENLSYGLQRRLEIARAIATGARFLILDEPAAGMNPQESEDLLNFIRELRSKGYTILIIEHDMNVVMNISDRICVMDYGKKIADGLPEDIIIDPMVIKAYLGDTSEIAKGVDIA